jgi:hypothetical protein
MILLDKLRNYSNTDGRKGKKIQIYLKRNDYIIILVKQKKLYPKVIRYE